MKYHYRIKGLTCAHCAEKMERSIKKIPEVQEASIAFMSQRLNIETDEIDAALPKIKKSIQKIEKRCTLV